MMSTRVERSILIPVPRWGDDGENIPHEWVVVVSADTTLSCCVVSDHNKKKIQIEFLQLGGGLKGRTCASTFWDAIHAYTFVGFVRTSVYAYINNSRDREDEQIVLDLHGEFPASTMRVEEADDSLWLKRSGIWVKDSHPGSTTLELRCEGRQDTHADSLKPHHHFLFTERHPVTLEGELPDYLNAALSINFDVRYQFELFDDQSGRALKVVDFDCVFEFRTKEISCNES
ncbi:unnamed protein product [Calypogeia fissa]